MNLKKYSSLSTSYTYNLVLNINILFQFFHSTGELFRRLEDIGRKDAADSLISGCPLYRITSLDEGLAAASSAKSLEESAAAAAVSASSWRFSREK